MGVNKQIWGFSFISEDLIFMFECLFYYQSILIPPTRTDPTNQSSTPAETLTCWVYLLPTFPATMLQKPMLASYADSADQPYQIGSVRLPTLRAADDLAF